MRPTAQWLARWNACREKTWCSVDLNEYFSEHNIAGRELSVVEIGPCSLPTGQVLVRDPLCHLADGDPAPYFQSVPAGEYQAELCVVLPEGENDCPRYAAARVCFSAAPAVRFEEALVGDEPLEELEERGYFGVSVDAGLVCICDKAAQLAYCTFVAGWQAEHPGGSLYNDYFAPLFADSYINHPVCQRAGGDFLCWRVPGTAYTLAFFQAGYGDGVYPVYLGYDGDGAVCQLVVHTIDIRGVYERPSAHLSIEDFAEGAGRLTGSVCLPLWDSLFTSTGPYRLDLLPEQLHMPERLTSAHRKGYDFVVANQDEIFNSILTALFEIYPALRKQYSYDDEDLRMPDLEQARDLARLLTPAGVVIHPVDRDGMPYVGYAFFSAWDMPHGFGALLYGSRVVRIGPSDTAYDIETARRDLAEQANRLRKDEILKILRATDWAENQGSIYVTASYRGHSLFFYFAAFDETRLLHFEQGRLKSLISHMEDLDKQARSVVGRTRPDLEAEALELSQISINADGTFLLGYDLGITPEGKQFLCVPFDWHFQAGDTPVYDTYQ